MLQYVAIAIMVGLRKPLNVRIPIELYQKIESEDKSKQDIVTESLLLFFDSKKRQDVAMELEHEKEKTKLLENSIQILEGRIKDLQSQNGFLIQDHSRISSQLDRLLMPSQEEITKKAWWKFWKK